MKKLLPNLNRPKDEKESMSGDKKNGTVSRDTEGRRLYYTGTIDEDKCERIVTSLLDLEAKDPLKDIILYIDSYGGYVDSFFAMHDAIKMLRCNVATIGIGKTMSCGFLLLISGTPGYRFICPNARVLIHKVCAGTFGNVSDMEDDVNAALDLQKRVCNKIVEYTKISKKQLEKMMERQTYLSAEEAVKLGIVDEIATSNKQIYKKVRV